MKKYLLLLLIFLGSTQLSAGQEPSETYSRLFASPELPGKIRERLEALAADPGRKIAGDRFHNVEYVSNLYVKNEYRPFWTEEAFMNDAVNAIAQSYNDGLIPLDYHLQEMLLIKTALLLDPKITEEKLGQAADLELLLTDGIIFYADHLLYGKCDPVTLVPTWNFGFAPVPDINPGAFREAITGRKVMERLLALRPPVFLYDTLVARLSDYRRIEAEGGWGTIPTGGKIEPGDRDARIPMIRKRLHAVGMLSMPDSMESTLYDPVLEKDVKRFQSTHGLDADGVAGAGTFREMNIPVGERIATLRVNLERIRWVGNNLPESYLIVNIAAFWLLLVEQGEITHFTRVVVGKPYTKTPVFRDKLRYIDFNPTWTVPRSIIKNEIIPKLKKDSLHLQKNNMVLLDSKGNEVPLSSIDIPSLTPGRFPYLVRQQPGPDNALGVVKFMFPNEYDIYLHDTPSKSLFRKASRAFSHGCIRVENPLDLAVKLLEDTDWTREKIDRVVKTRETTRVMLPSGPDVLLMYWTCGIDRNRDIFFAPDIYSRDAEVLRELDRKMW